MLADRPRRLAALAGRRFDAAVVGGGITGAGVALDLTLRGLAVLLVERGDWAGRTSSASSRLVHGGLRYLEQLELGLVREACLERDLLLTNAGGYVWPEQFLFPVRQGDRVGRFRMQAGLWLYTALSVPRALGVPGALAAADVARRLPGVERSTLRGAGTYLDAATDDARLTLAVVASAAAAGAVTLSRMEATGLAADAGGVTLELHDRESGGRHDVRARGAVLAAGAETDRLRGTAGLDGRWIAATRGSHVLVPRARLPCDGAVIFPSPQDGRILFLIPWPLHTVIGTTDLDAGPDGPVRATAAEVDYLLASANDLCPGAGLGRDDVVSTYAGLRPLLAGGADAPSARSREERIERDGPVWTIAGGKLTGWRAMAERLGAGFAAALGDGLAARRSPTRILRLAGAAARRTRRPPWSSDPALPAERLHEDALLRRYGARAAEVAAFLQEVPDGRTPLDGETRLGEVDWSVRHEDCLHPIDFLLRRSDCGRGSPAAAALVTERVLARMADLLGWDAAAQATRAAETAAELELLHAWRDDR